MSIDKLFIDNPEKTTFNDNDIIPGTDVIGGRDVYWRFATFKSALITAVAADVEATPTPGAGFGETAPTNPYTGQVWFNASEGYRIYIWNGTEWVDVQKVLDLDDFGLGVKPIKVVNTLPGSGDQGEVVFLTTDNKLYRWNGTEWITAVEAADVIGQLVADQIADAALTIAKFAAGLTPIEIVSSLPASGLTVGRTVYLTTDGKLYRYNGTAWTSAVPSTDITGTLTDAQIAALAASKITGQLTDAQIAAVAAAKLTGQITTTQITDSAITTGKIAAANITTALIAAGAVVADNVAANAITAAKIDAGAVTTAKLAANAVEAGNIAASAVTTDKLDANSVTTGKIAANAITTGTIAAGAITATEIAAGEVQATHLATDSVTAAKIAATAIQTYHIQAAAVEADKLAANSVTAGKIAAGIITATHIGTNEIIAVAANIKDGIITSAKIGSLDAGKINAGDISAVNIARSGRIYNPTYVGHYFKTVETATGTNASHNFGSGTGFGFTHDTGVRMYGPSSGSTPIFNPSDSGSAVFLFFGALYAYAADLTIYYRKNGTGSYISLGAFGATAESDYRISMRREITGLSPTDFLDFYIAPCSGTGDVTSAGLTLHWDLDVMVFNW